MTLEIRDHKTKELILDAKWAALPRIGDTIKIEIKNDTQITTKYYTVNTIIHEISIWEELRYEHDIGRPIAYVTKQEN